MANLDELFSALQKADAAGNAEDAKQIASIIQQQGDFISQKLPTPKKGILAQATKGTKGIISSLQTGAESLIPGIGKNVAAVEGIERKQKLGEEYDQGASLEKVKEAYRNKGIFSAAGEAISQVPGAIAEQVPQLGAMFAGARLGGAAAGPYGALIGAAAVPLAQFYGNNLERQAQAQLASGDPVEVDRGKAAIAAAPQAALDIVQQRLVFGSRLFSKALGIPEATLAKRSAEQVEKLAREKLLPTLLKGTAKGVVAEIPTEIGQQMIERAQAGLSLTSPDALAEYGETAYQVGLLGPLGAVGRISEKGAARAQVAGKEAADAAILADQQNQAVPPVTPPTTGMAPITPGAPIATPPATVPTLFEPSELPAQLTPDTVAGKTIEGAPIAVDTLPLEQQKLAELERNIEALTQQGTPEALAQAETLKQQLPEAPEAKAFRLGEEMMQLERKYKELELQRDETKPLKEKEPLSIQMKTIKARQNEILNEGEVLKSQGVSFEAPAGQADLNLENAVTEDAFKEMGIGKSNKNLRKAILGKRLSDPAEYDFVIKALDAFANSKNVGKDMSTRVNQYARKLEQEPPSVSRKVSNVGAGTSQPSISVPSGQFRPTPGLTASSTAGLDSVEPDVGGPIAGTRAARKIGKASVDSKIKYRTATPNMDGMSVNDVQGVVNRTIDGWKNSPLIQVVQFENQLPQAVQRQIERDGVIRPQGLWDEDTQAVFLIADNLESQKDVVLTIAHESLGHYGLRTILGDSYSKVMNQMYQNKDVKVRADNKIDRGMDKETAVEEVLAEMAEQQVPPTAIQKLINIMRQLMAKLGFPMKGVTNGEIKQLLENARQYVIEGKGEAGKGGMKVGKVFSGEAPIFYSKLAVMTQYAPKNLKDGASGKTWADWINSNAGKFGVKKEEIEWSGVNDLLALMEKDIKLTSKSVADMFKDTGVKVNEVVYGGEVNKALMEYLVATEDSLMDDAYNLTKEMLEKEVFLPDSYYGKQVEGYKAVTKNGYDANFSIEPIHVPILENTFDFKNFKPEFAKEYKVKVQSIQRDLKNVFKDINRALRNPTRFDPYKTHGGKNYGEIVLTLPEDITDRVYTHPHWPGVDNPIAHARFSEFTDADGKRVLLVDEVQSDFGQEGKDEGFGGLTVSPEAFKEAIEREASTNIALNQAVRKAVEDGRMRDTFDSYPPDVEKLFQDFQQAINDANVARNARSVPNAPFVQDTRSWTALVVKRLLRYAADNGISRIAFIDGQTAHVRFPKSVKGGSTEKGMKTYYDQILPSVTKEVLNKLGASSKLTTSTIELTPRPGYSVFVNGELVAGPFENESDAITEGAELTFSGQVDEDAVEIKSAGMPNFKSFTAFDIAPETAVKVKEGQALFRTATTSQGQQAEADMFAFGGKPEPKEESFIDRQKSKFNASKNKWQENYELNGDWVSATFGKMQNIASFDQAFNNRLYNHFTNLKKQGVMTMQQVESALIRISAHQAVHRGNLANQIIDRGNYSYNPVTNGWTSVEDPVNMKAFEGLIRSLGTKLGVEPNRARQIMGAAYEANRLQSMYQDLSTAQKDLATAEADLKTLKDPKLKATKKKLIDALKDDIESLTDKVQHKSATQVEAGMRLYNAHPEIQEGTKVWNTMRERVVKMLVETGVKTPEQAEAWLDEAAYVPFFRNMEEEKNIGPQIVSRGLRESMKDYGLKGSMRDVNDPIENMYQWMQWSIARAISNKQLQVMVDSYRDALPSEVRDGKGENGKTFSIYRDGVQKFYNVDDAAIAQAFVGLEPVIFPAIKYFATTSNFLRHAVTRMPLFPVVQIFNDSYNAMFVSGLKNPFGLLKEIGKEIVATAQGTSETRNNLIRQGILETNDVNALNEADAIGRRLNLNEPGAWAKLARTLDRFSSVSDNVIRQGIYNQAIKEGLSPELATIKAAEVVNFRRVSGNETMQLLSRIVPFFNAYTQVASVAVKTLTGRGISPQERDVAVKTLIGTTAKIMLLSMVYSMAVGDDEDYLKKNRVSRDRMFMIPGSGGFGVPIRMDVFAIPKLAGEYGYQLMTDSMFTDSKMLRESLARAVKGSIMPPSEGVPQLVRPALGVIMNYDAFQDREIINATMRRLDPERQYTKTTSEMAKALGAMTGMSPLNIDFLLRGYLGSVATLTSLATNDAINAVRGGPPRPDQSIGNIISSLPNMGAMMSKEENTAVLSDFYEVARDVNKAVDTLSSMKYASPEAKQAYREENKKELALKGQVQAINKQLTVLRRREQMVRESPEERMSAEQKQAELKRIDELRSRMTKNIMRIRQKLYE
jgi:hypothetical protein